MRDLPKFHARALGLKFNKAGLRLSVPKDSPAAELWNEALLASNPKAKSVNKQAGNRTHRKEFRDVKALIEQHAPNIWGQDDRSGLVLTHEYDEYTMDLFWPQHRREIVSTFRKLYNARIKKHRAYMKAKQAAKREERKKRKATKRTRELTKNATKRKTSAKRTATKVPTTEVPVQEEIHQLPDIKVASLAFTKFWIIATDGSQQAEMFLDVHDTIDSLFEGMSRALSGSQYTEGHIISKVVIHLPWHLGGLSGSISIQREDKDELVRQLRHRLSTGWKEARERSGERIDCVAIVHLH